MGETYNKALQISQGELIAVLEGNDFWPADKLEKQFPAFERKEVVLSWGKAAVTNSRGKTLWIISKSLSWFKNRTRIEVLRTLHWSRACSQGDPHCLIYGSTQA